MITNNLIETCDKAARPRRSWLRVHALASLAVIVFLHGCATTDNASRDGTRARTPVGQNLVDEACYVQDASLVDAIDAAVRVAHVYCGSWEHESARLIEVEAERTASDWLKDSDWDAWLAKRMACGSEIVDATTPGSSDFLVRECQLNNGGWPYSAVLARAGSRTYLADGVPAALPAIERAIGIMSGTLTPAQATASQTGRASGVIAALEAALKGRLYGAGDLQTYYRLMTLGQHHNSVKDFASAEKRYREAWSIHERLLGVANPRSADVLMHVALELSNQERFTEANALFARAETLLNRNAGTHDNARLQSYLGLHAANQGDFEAALVFSQKATETRQMLADPSSLDAPAAGPPVARGTQTYTDVLTIGEDRKVSDADVVQSLYLEAAMHQRMGRLADGERALDAARSAFARAANPPAIWEPQLASLGSELAAERGNLRGAGQQRRIALDLLEKEAPRQRPTALANLALGNTLLQTGERQEALAAFRDGVRLARERNEGLRVYQITPYLDALLVEDTDGAYGENALEMLDAAQLVRSGITTQNIAKVAARLASTEDRVGQAVRALQDAEDRRTLLERQYDTALLRIDAVDQEARLDALSGELIAVNQELQSLSAQVQAASPGYNQLIVNGVGAQRVAAALAPREVFLQVLPGADKTYVFFLNGAQARAYAVPIGEDDLNERVSALRDALDLTRTDGKLRPFDVGAAHRLYTQLFSPIAVSLESASHATVVTSGALLSLPFSVFVTTPPNEVQNKDYTDIGWLARKVAISVLPSARSFVDLRKTAQPSLAPKAFVGFGDFVPFGEQTASILPIPDECRRDSERASDYRGVLSGLAALPATGAELRAVGARFTTGASDIFLGPSFNEREVVTAPLGDYRVVYFATHALLPYELECQPEPSLVASLAAPEPGHDGFLSTSEIVRLDLDADLVVLSACNTGGPDERNGGESLSGLARAFFFAGARSLLVSHWPVEDQSTAALMTSLFDGLQSSGDLSLAEGLREAKLSLLDSVRGQDKKLRSHPLFWGAFTLVGDGARSIRTL